MTTSQPANNWLDRNRGLLRIIGARLTSVQFVLNYLILGFDERGALTTLVWPELTISALSIKYGDLEYRNHLCGLIEHTVTGAVLDAEETVTISFDNLAAPVIRLGEYTGRGERAILTGPGGHYLQVF